MEIEISGVKIELTQEQLRQIREQTDPKYALDHLKNYLSACRILGEEFIREDRFPTKQSYHTHVLETIIKAANFIDNNYKVWIPDFTDNADKWYNWFERKKLGWSFVDSYVRRSYSFCSVRLYFLKESTAKLIANRFLSEYNNYLG